MIGQASLGRDARKRAMLSKQTRYGVLKLLYKEE